MPSPEEENDLEKIISDAIHEMILKNEEINGHTLFRKLRIMFHNESDIKQQELIANAMVEVKIALVKDEVFNGDMKIFFKNKTLH